MTVTTKSPLKIAFEPAKDPVGDYFKILKDVGDMPASLLYDPIGKWWNPRGEHFTIEIYPDNPWHRRDIASGRLVKVKKTRKAKQTPDAAPGNEEK